MKSNFYLKVNSRGSVNTTKTRPYLQIDEVSLFVTLDLPDTLFKKPQITANIKVSDNDVTPFQIDADTLNNVKDAIETSTGLNITMKLENPEGSPKTLI